MAIAPLKNIEILLATVEDVKNRTHSLPGFVVFNGFSGFGKSYAAAYVANTFNATYVEVGASWSLSIVMDKICMELGVLPPSGAIAKKVDAVVEKLKADNTVLILDEFDHLVKPRSLEIVREIYDRAGTPIILIGEEALPNKLRSVERFHNRIYKWVQALPASLDDAKKLTKIYSPKVEIADDLLKKLVDLSQGRVRRIAVNLDNISKTCQREGIDRVDLKTWGKRELFTGDAPVMRRYK